MIEKLKFMMSSIWTFLLPFIRQMMTDAGRVLSKAAEDAVKAVQESMGDAEGSAKRDAAFKMILATLTAAGISLAKSLIYAAIEAAVLKYKSDQA